MGLAMVSGVTKRPGPNPRYASAVEDRSLFAKLRFAATALAVWLSIFLTVRAFASTVQIPPHELERVIAERVMRVEEFKVIREAAEAMGVKVYLFGGTAAGFGHYVKWDLQREKGDTSFQTETFDYDYTNIYRSTQDLDIVLDGSAEQAARLEEILMSKFPYMRGGKSKWEVRLLRAQRGEKIPLLENPDFLNQHTDSNSTGMIEVSKAKDGEGVVRDLRDWTSRTPHFLKDVAEGKIHYYDSPSHHTTSHYRNGENPPIFSVIRYLTKAFQFELEMRSEDLEIVRRRIAEFDPRRDLATAKARNWVEKNAPKLVQNAVNIEYAIETLDALGLRKKLVALGDPREPSSMAWWLSREPLRSRPLGRTEVPGRTGKTAAELKIDVVAHETRSFLAYESITRSHKGAANALVSRQGVAGEAAAHGNGFYTRIGRQGAVGSNITIRFRLDPRAREFVDFSRAGDYVIVTNKAALSVIPESLDIGLVDFVELVTSPDFEQLKSEYALMEKLRRRLAKWSGRDLNHEDKARLRPLFAAGGPAERFVRTAGAEEIVMLARPFSGTPYEKWFRKRVSNRDLAGSQRLRIHAALGWVLETDDILKILHSGAVAWESSFDSLKSVTYEAYARSRDPRLLEAFVRALNHYVDSRGIDGFENGFEEFWKDVDASEVLAPKKEELREMIIRGHESSWTKGAFDVHLYALVTQDVSDEQAARIRDRFLVAPKASDNLFNYLVQEWEENLGRERMDKIIDRLSKGNYKHLQGAEETISRLFDVARRHHPEAIGPWLTSLLENPIFADRMMVELEHDSPARRRGIVRKILESPHRQFRVAFARHLLSEEAWARPDWISHLMKFDKANPPATRLRDISFGLRGRAWVEKHPEIVDAVVDHSPLAATFLFESPEWITARPDALTRLMERLNGSDLNPWTMRDFLKLPQTAGHPEWVEIVIRKKAYFTDGVGNLNEVFALPHWKNDPVLREIARRSGLWNRVFTKVTLESLREGFVAKNLTVEQIRAELAQPKATLTRKILKPLSRAAPSCESVFAK